MQTNSCLLIHIGVAYMAYSYWCQWEGTNKASSGVTQELRTSYTDCVTLNINQCHVDKRNGDKYVHVCVPACACMSVLM